MSAPSRAPVDEGSTAQAASRRRKGHDSVHVVVWSSVIILMVLGLYYGLRATSNRNRLVDRNLRELDRIGRTVESRVESFRDALTSLVGQASTWGQQAALIPDLVSDSLWDCETPEIRIDREIRICSVEQSQGAGGAWTLAPLRRAMATDLFDAVFLADTGRVVALVSNPSAGGLRLDRVPSPDSASNASKKPVDESTARSVTIAGRGYELFLQPLRLPPPTGSQAGGAPPDRWVVGGLVSTARFRADSLALGPTHLVFLGLVLILTFFSLPFVRVTLIGPREHVRIRDVYLLSVSLVLLTGLMGLGLGELTYYRQLEGRLDKQLDSTADRLAGTFRDETRAGLAELVRQTNEFVKRGVRPGTSASVTAGMADRARIFWSGVPALQVDTAGIRRRAPSDTATKTSRYLGFQMVYWTDPKGMQVAKWTPRAANTNRVNVADRDYFRELKERDGWRVARSRIGLVDPPQATDTAPSRDTVQYYVQSLRSKTTGEHDVAMSLPFCWSRSPWWTPECPEKDMGVAVILTPLASVDHPVLPAGVEFAVIDPAGQTLFHSRPERILDENFFAETNDDPVLRSMVAARVIDRLNATYMGRSTRLQVKPITGTPLSLVVILDDQYLGSIQFQTLALAIAMFGSWVAVLWLLFVFVELATPGRLQWAWPDRRYPQKYRALVEVLGAFAVLLLVQGALAIHYPVHPSSVLVPVQALAFGLLILSKKPESKRPGQSSYQAVPPLRRPAFLGWAGLSLATALQIVFHLHPWVPGWHFALLALQLVAVGWGVSRVLTLDLPAGARADPSRPVGDLYVASIGLTLVVVGLLPALLFYQESFAAHVERFVRYEQTEIVQGLHRRADRVWNANRMSALPEQYDALVLADTAGLAFEPFLDTRLMPAGGASGDAAACRWERGATLRQTLKPVIEIPPWYVTDVAARMGNLTRAGTDGYRWTCSGDTLELAAAGYTLRSFIPSGLWYPTEWWVLGLVAAVGLLIALPNWLGRRVFLLGLDPPGTVTLENVLAAREKGTSLVVVCTRSMDRTGLPALLNDLENRENRKNREIACVDLLEFPVKDEQANEAALKARTQGKDLICLDHFDQRLSEASWARPLLACLEGLVFGKGREVVLLTSRDPSTLFPEPEAPSPGSRKPTPKADAGGAGAKGAKGSEGAKGAEGSEGGAGGDAPKAEASDAGHAESAEDTLRWTRLLGRFVKVTINTFDTGTAGAPSVAKPDDLARELEPVFDRESGSHPFVANVALQAARQWGAAGLSPDAFVDRIREMADGYYRALWSILEPEEKLVVAQLAEGVVVNPKCERAIRRLLERKVLVRDPALRLMNESFARFVREEVSMPTLATWEQTASTSTWERVRFPILLGVVVLAVFLFTTQRATFDTVVAILSAAAVGTTAAVRVVGLARSGGGGS